MFAGIAICGRCGTKMTVVAGRRKGSKTKVDQSAPRYGYYTCAAVHDGRGCEMPSINRERVEGYILTALRRVGQNRPLLERIVSEIAEKQNTSVASLTIECRTTQKAINRLEKRKENLLENFAAEKLSETMRETLGKQVDQVQNELSALRTRLYSMEALVAVRRTKNVDVDLVASVLMAPETYLPKLDMKERRAVLRTIVPRIEVFNETEVHVTVSLPSGEELTEILSGEHPDGRGSRSVPLMGG